MELTPSNEAVKIKNGICTFILIEIELVHDLEENQFFKVTGSYPEFPLLVLNKEVNNLCKKYNLTKESFSYDQNDKISCNKLVRFWHFLGDATNCSDIIKTPYGFYEGLNININTKYSTQPTKAVVKSISLTRQNEEKWFWLIAIEKTISFS